MAASNPPTPALTLSTHQHQDVALLAVNGEVDMATAPDLRQTLGRCLEREPPLLVVDLSQVSFLGSAGLAALVEAQQHARATQLRLVATHRAVLRPLQVTGLTATLAVYTTWSDACAISSDNTATDDPDEERTWPPAP
jgi:anti-sigma B factor antagonist